jgi:hypothetical protein
VLYRGKPEVPTKLFLPSLEQWEWTGEDPSIEIIAYRPVPHD